MKEAVSYQQSFLRFAEFSDYQFRLFGFEFPVCRSEWGESAIKGRRF
jgi:hypothetical protein